MNRISQQIRRKPSAFHVYITLELAAALLYSLIFTVDSVYHVTVARLNPLQLVLVGTILETTVFLFEIPTGVLADVKSRRWSVILGYFLVGLAFILEGSLPFFWTIALAQVVWGIGHTFTSGATQAWIADEVGEARAGEAFLRGSQGARVGALVAIPLGILLGRGNVALPVVLGGVGMAFLAIFLLLAMREEGFQPTPAQDRTSLGSMLKTMQDARQLTRRQPVVLTLLGIGFFYGLYSEGFDRLSTIHLLRGFVTPWLQAVQPVVWYGALRGVQQLAGLLLTEIIRKRVQTRQASAMARVLRSNTLGIILALAGFALTRNWGLAVVLYLCVQTLRIVNGPLQDAWLNQRIDNSQVRATVFSVSSQVDAIGQITGGPLVGGIGNAVSVRAALLTSALLLSPVLRLYSAAMRHTEALRGGRSS